MKVTVKKLADLVEPKRNVRLHNSTQLEEFKRSIEMFGQIRPIVVDENNVILAGNGLYKAMSELGKDTADCYVVTGLDEKAKKKLMLVDNRIFALGADDPIAFEEIISELGTDFDVPGFDPDLLSALAMTDDEIDDTISAYGVVTEEQKESMKKAQESLKREEEVEIEKSEEVATIASRGEARDRQEPLNNRYIICPKCGEKVWL